MPQAIDSDDVRAALEELVQWREFARSPQLAAFLRYVVEARLRGDAASIKAYAIAVDVFGRPADFDPQVDPIVRVQARRLRGLLDRFYEAGLATVPVRIAIPTGRYVPEFTALAPGAPASADRPVSPAPEAAAESQGSGSAIWIAGLLAALIVLGTILFWNRLADRPLPAAAQEGPLPPMVLVAPFEDITGLDAVGAQIAGLAVELATDLDLFEDVVARYATNGTLSEVLAAARPGQPVFTISGVARPGADAAQYGFVLTNARTDDVVWSLDLAVPLREGQPQRSTDAVSRHAALALGSHHGPLHRAGRAWLADHPEPVAATPYVCLLAFYAYRNSRLDGDHARAQRCAESLDTRAPQWPVGQAMRASLMAETAALERTPGSEAAALFDESHALIEEAMAADPVNGFVWEQRAHLAFLADDFPAAAARYAAALQLNPANADAVAGAARLAAYQGDWSGAEIHAEAALAAVPEPPAWYHAAPALAALRAGDHDGAVRHGTRLASADPDLAAAILVAASGLSDTIDLLNPYLPRLLSSPRYRRLGVLPALRQRLSDPELIAAFTAGLSRAGIPIDRLARPF